MPGKYTGKTRAEVRAMVLANNKNKNASDTSVQSMTHELKLWKLQNASSKKTTKKSSKKEEETTSSTKESDSVEVEQDDRRDMMAGWYERSLGDPEEKGHFLYPKKYPNVNMNQSFDENINIRNSDLSNPEIMKIKNRNRVALGLHQIDVDAINIEGSATPKKAPRGFKMPGYGKRK
jgi:hypothetical protein